jgi:hypothetical protein
MLKNKSVEAFYGRLGFDLVWQILLVGIVHILTPRAYEDLRRNQLKMWMTLFIESLTTINPIIPTLMDKHFLKTMPPILIHGWKTKPFLPPVNDRGLILYCRVV